MLWRLPSSIILPLPTAMIVPSLGLSFAFSGRTMPPLLTSAALVRCTMTWDPWGLILALAIGVCLWVVGCGLWVVGQRVGDRVPMGEPINPQPTTHDPQDCTVK